jgi:hypothetical protein
MPGKDGTGPLGMGPCGKNGCECRKKLARAEKGKTGGQRRNPEARQPDGEPG